MVLRGRQGRAGKFQRDDTLAPCCIFEVHRESIDDLFGDSLFALSENGAQFVKQQAVWPFPCVFLRAVPEPARPNAVKLRVVCDQAANDVLVPIGVFPPPVLKILSLPLRLSSQQPVGAIHVCDRAVYGHRR